MRSIGCAMVMAFVVTAAAASDDPTTPVAKAYEIDVGDVAVTKGRMPWEEPSREALFSNAWRPRSTRRTMRRVAQRRSARLRPVPGPTVLRHVGSEAQDRLARRGQGGRRGEVSGSGPQSAEFDTVLERGAWRIDDIKEPDSDKKGAPVSIAEILKGAHPCGSDAARPCDWPPPPSPPSATVASPKTTPADLVRAMYKIAFKGAAETDASAKGYGDPGFRASYFTAALRRAADGIDAYELKFHGEILDWDPVLSTNGFADVTNFAVRVTKSDAKTPRPSPLSARARIAPLSPTVSSEMATLGALTTFQRPGARETTYGRCEKLVRRRAGFARQDLRRPGRFGNAWRAVRAILRGYCYGSLGCPGYVLPGNSWNFMRRGGRPSGARADGVRSAGRIAGRR